MGVQTRSQVAGHHEEEGQDIQSPLNLRGAGTSRAVAATTVPLEEFEALKRENQENRRMTQELVSALKVSPPNCLFHQV